MTQVIGSYGALLQTPVMAAVCAFDAGLHPALAALEHPQRVEMLKRSRVRELEPGQTLFRQGEHARHFYLVRSGHIKLYRLSPQGQEKVIEIINPGQSFAEAALFMEQPVYPVCSAALEAAVVEGLDGDYLRAILAESPRTAIEMLRILSVRQHKLISEIEALSLQNAMLRVANYLLREASAGQPGDEIMLVSQKKIIASRLSTQPETLSRILGSLESAGIILKEGACIRVTDPDTLAGIASGEQRLPQA